MSPPISLGRVMLFVQDVERLSTFYRDAFGFELTEHTEGEWAVLRAGQCELALHRVGAAWRQEVPSGTRAQTNVKLVFNVTSDLEALREELLGHGVTIGPITTYPDGPGPLCDGADPEGNVFQLVGA